MESRGKLLIFGTITIVSIIIAGLILMRARVPRDADSGRNGVNVGNAQNSLIVSDQEPGDRVIVAFASVDGRGFVVAHEIDPGGNPGTVLGVSELIDTSSNNIRILLGKLLVDGDRIMVMLYKDTNNDLIFLQTEDVPAYDANGDYVRANVRVGSTFNTNTAPEDNALNQPAESQVNTEEVLVVE